MQRARDATVGTGSRESLHAGGLVAVAGLLAWTLGRPLLFPSLGPTAYALATAPGADTSRPHRVLGGHAVGVVAGLAAWWLLAPPAPLTAGGFQPASQGAARLAASGILATGLTAGGMLATDLRHPPACATTLIVSLGLLATLQAGAGILAAVAALLVADGLGTGLARRATVG